MSFDARYFQDETVKMCFYNGAPAALHQMLKAFEFSNPAHADLQTLLSTAERFDSIYHFLPDSKFAPATTASLPQAQTTATAPTFTPVDPYAMEIDNLSLPQVFINAIAREVQRQSYQRGSRPNNNQHQWNRNNNNNRNSNRRYTNNNNSNHNVFALISPEERQHLAATGGCFKCCQPGHQAYENHCSPSSRNMNQIATNVGAPFYGPSGNAPSGQA
ncbi:hypothetical protein EC968_009457 [Mortierella alpina]|nr:hypothetical protein EC968_009457 [Mortierella alpina]